MASDLNHILRAFARELLEDAEIETNHDAQTEECYDVIDVRKDVLDDLIKKYEEVLGK